MSNETTYLTELEIAVLNVFVKLQIFRSEVIVSVLKNLIEKLEK